MNHLFRRLVMAVLAAMPVLLAVPAQSAQTFDNAGNPYVKSKCFLRGMIYHNIDERCVVGQATQR